MMKKRKWVYRILNYWEGEKRLTGALKYMSFEKLYNAVMKYQKQAKAITDHEKHAVFARYSDYLMMRAELGYDMTNEVYLRPKNLKEKHDEMADEKNKKADSLYAEKMEAKYQKIRTRYEELEKEYGFAADGYMIRPAKNATEIIQEGRTLHHCVARMGYMEKHDQGKSFILFLRKSEEPENPYYTIEIRGKEILQWYGLQDRKPDEEIIGPWLNEFIAHIGGNQVVYA